MPIGLDKEMMNQRSRERNRMKKQYRLLCLAALCTLYFCACGQVGEARQEENIVLKEAVEAEGTTKAASDAIGSIKIISDLSKARNADEILTLLIEDEGVRYCVRSGIDFEEADLLGTVLQKLEDCERLELKDVWSDCAVCSLKDLSHLPNLKQLILDFGEWDDSSIVDFSPIAQLSQLEQLTINYEKEEEIDLSFLGEMHSLNELYLTRCRIGDASFLGEMPQLQRLSLYETPVEDLAVLEKLPKLLELSLSGNTNAKHIEAVGTLKNMEDLGIQYCGITDIGFLSGLTKLRALNLNGNSVTDITPLAGLDKLERLGLAENEIQDISVLAGLENLFDLALDGNEIQDISALTGLLHLNELGISDNKIEDLSGLADLQELTYAAVFGNPMKSIRPLWEIPWLACPGKGVSKEAEAFIAEWLGEHYPEAVEFTGIDFLEGDLNDDGLSDVAFVVDSAAFDIYEEHFPERMPDDRRFFLLLQQRDGSWMEVDTDLWLGSSTSGGLRGDPYRGAFMGTGFLVIKTGWGSSSGSVETEFYEYRKGRLCLESWLRVDDYKHEVGYDVQSFHESDNSWKRFVLAWDGYRMVRIDLEDSENPAHKAFPKISLFEGSYYLYDEKIETSITSQEALDRVCAAVTQDPSMVEAAAMEEEITMDQKISMEENVVMENLPYADWQKEGCELLRGITLPDYYYVLSATKIEPDDETKGWDGDYIYYDGVTERDGVLCHVIRLEQRGGNKVFLLHDVTGEIEELEE